MSGGGRMPKIVLAALFLTPNVFAAPDPTAFFCATGKLVAARPVPGAIVRADVPTREVELPKVGKKLAPGENFRSLQDDEYIYLILNPSGKPGGETIYYSPRVPADVLEKVKQTGKKPARFLGTHRSLLQSASEELGIPISEVEKQVRGAGGFRFTSGHVTRVTNKASTFPAGRESLEYSADVLSRRGFNPSGGRFEMVDLEKQWKDRPGNFQNPFQVEEEEAARMALDNFADPDRFSIREGMTHVHAYLVSKFPDPERPGHFNMTEVLKARSAYLATLPPERRVLSSNAITDVLYYLGRSNREGFDFAVHDLCRRNPDRCLARYEECELELVAAAGIYQRGGLVREF